MPTGSMRRIKDEQFGLDEARHLLCRAGFGGSESQIERLAGLGPEASVDWLLGVESAGATPVESDLFDGAIMQALSEEQRRAYRRARQSGDEDTLARFREARQERQRRDRAQIRDIQQWWIKRLIESPAPLQEKMTLFWHGHFATSYRTIENSYHMFQQNQLFRTYAVGSFADLCYRIIRDPAMLAYLDNNDSRKGRPNENLARELLELFCLGEGNYGENDIKEGARALTGYTFQGNEFAFRRDWHDQGMKHILRSSGPLDGDDFVSAILKQKACAQHIAGKLHAFFVTGPLNPEDRQSQRIYRRVVSSLAAELRDDRYELEPMLRRLFLSEHFYDPAHRLSKIKSPVELVAGTIRSLGTPVPELRPLQLGLDRMGQTILFPPSVKGWDGGRVWINTSTLFVRQNVTTYLLTGGDGRRKRRNDYDPMSLLKGMPEQDPRAVCERLLRINIGSLMRDDHVRVLMEFLKEHEFVVSRETVLGMLALITAMPEYQLC